MKIFMTLCAALFFVAASFAQVSTTQARSVGVVSLEAFLIQKSQEGKELSQDDYQAALRIIQVSKVSLADIFAVKMKMSGVLSAERFLKDVLDVQDHLQRIQMDSQLHCRFALTNTPWVEVSSTRNEIPSVYAGCWTSKDQDPLVKAGYDLETLKKIETSSVKDSIFIRR